MPFGLTWDEILAYHTPKYVSIHSKRLGALYYGLCILVVLWVFGFQILYGNEHFQVYDVKGTATLNLQQPTKNYCDPRDDACTNALKKPEELPYCEGYTGSTSGDVPKRECIYADLVSLSPSHRNPDSMYIPSRLDSVEQVRGCDMTRDQTGYCNRLWDNAEHKKTYVADIEDYTVRIMSTYLRKGIQGTSLNQQGFYYECVDKDGKVLATEPCHGKLTIKPIECLPGTKGCDGDADASLAELGDMQDRAANLSQKKMRGSRQVSFAVESRGSMLAQAESRAQGKRRDVYSIAHGDVFTVGKLMQLAGLDLDQQSEKGSVRHNGAEVSIAIEYRNLKKWFGISNVSYVYRVVPSPMGSMKMNVYSQVQPLDEHRRKVEYQHGIHLQASVSGSFGVFNIVYLLVMMTTSLALLNGAKAFVDALAIYTPSKRQEAYTAAKYEAFLFEEGTDNHAKAV